VNWEGCKKALHFEGKPTKNLNHLTSKNAKAGAKTLSDSARLWNRIGRHTKDGRCQIWAVLGGRREEPIRIGFRRYEGQTKAGEAGPEALGECTSPYEFSMIYEGRTPGA
jgi:hypothetical protein